MDYTSPVLEIWENTTLHEERKDTGNKFSLIQEVPPIQYNYLIKLVLEFQRTWEYAEALNGSEKWRVSPINWEFINSLNWKCMIYSSMLKRFLETEWVVVNWEFSNYLKGGTDTNTGHLAKAHGFLSVQTELGKLYLDPTLWQFVHYHKVFVWSKQDLRGIFLDPCINFYLWNRSWVLRDTIIKTKLLWWEILYGSTTP